MHLIFLLEPRPIPGERSDHYNGAGPPSVGIAQFRPALREARDRRGAHDRRDASARLYFSIICTAAPAPSRPAYRRSLDDWSPLTRSKNGNRFNLEGYAYAEPVRWRRLL
jgi:hypothetical protein